MDKLLSIFTPSLLSENLDELADIFDRQSSLSPNSMTLQGESPLHVSVRKDRVNSTKVLIGQGADVNVQVSNYFCFVVVFHKYKLFRFK